MPITASLDSSTRILRIWLTGEWPTLHEQAAFRRRVRSSNLLTPDVVVLADLTQLAAMAEPPWHQLQAAMQIPDSSGGPGRYALLVTPDLYSLGQVIESLAPAHLVFRAFTSESAALLWLVSEAV